MKKFLTSAAIALMAATTALPAIAKDMPAMGSAVRNTRRVIMKKKPELLKKSLIMKASRRELRSGLRSQQHRRKAEVLKRNEKFMSKASRSNSSKSTSSSSVSSGSSSSASSVSSESSSSSTGTSSMPN